MKRWVWLLLIALLAVGIGAGWWFRKPLWNEFRQLTTSVKSADNKQPKPDPKRYAVLISELARWRGDLAARYRKASNAAERSAVEHDARVILEHTLPAMMRCWLGTRWDFSGTAATPGGGRIACGYFVATVLQDAGFQVNRYQLAQQPSGNIMRSFLEKNACVLSVDQPYDQFADALQTASPGVYLVGLDTHVAFLVKNSDGFRFIHSSGSSPWCVVDEGRDEAGVLQRSSWRMLGNLTANPNVMQTWLKAEKITVRKTRHKRSKRKNGLSQATRRCQTRQILHHSSMNSANWLPALSALVLILTGCTSTKTSFSGNDPLGTGPFNRRGDYVDAWADDPSKWSRPGSRQQTNDLPVIAKTEEPPANANPLGTNKPSPREQFATTKVQTAKVDSTRPKPSATKPKTAASKPKPKASRYVVKKGDSLSAIASRNGSSVSAIQRANGISGSMIRPGQSLVIPKR
jgi:LysM repeat protein